MRLRHSAQFAEKTKTALVDLVDESWRKVRSLVDPACLPLCEDELRGATSMLVLATLHKAAGEYSPSRAALEWVLRSADVSGDGDLSHDAGLGWLASHSPVDHTDSADDSPSRRSSLSSVYRHIVEGTGSIDLGVNPADTWWDPMVLTLGQVLGSALCTLRAALCMHSAHSNNQT
ncbi:hypothetical protein EON64_18590, partial [archaeon]